MKSKRNNRQGLQSRFERGSKRFIYKLIYRLFGYRKRPLDKHRLLADLKQEVSGSLIVDGSERTAAPDLISIHVSHEDARSAGNLPELEEFLTREIIKYIRSCGYFVPVQPDIRLKSLGSLKKSQQKILCAHSSPAQGMTIDNLTTLRFNWAQGGKQIRLSSGSFTIGATKDCEQKISVKGLTGKLAYIELAANAVKVALLNKQVTAESEGVKFEPGRKYLVRPGSKVKFGNSISMEVLQS